MKARISVITGPCAGAQLLLDGHDTVLVGQSPEASLCLQGDPDVALYHAMLEVSLPRLSLRDLGTQRGTFVDSVPGRVTAIELSPGDVFRVGQSALRFELVPNLAYAPTELEAPPPAEGDRLVTVRCGLCGERTEHQVPEGDLAGAACFCDDCRQELWSGPPLLPGYTIERELGRGGMGVVYLARHETLGRRVLKVLLPEAAVREQNRRLFVREARKQAGLVHPNIVELFDFCEPSPGVFVAVLEHVDGLSCDVLLEQMGGRLPAPLALHIVAEALSGLSFMHGRGVVHRDIKEANLLVVPGAPLPRSVKIADFGLAKSFADAGGTHLTRPGQVGGTAPYMPPEQIRHFRDVQPSADIYAAGATLYRLLTGAYPHDFDAERHPFHVILTERIVPLATRLPGAPAELSAIIDHAMQREPGDRFESAAAMRDALVSLRSRGVVS